MLPKSASSQSLTPVALCGVRVGGAAHPLRSATWPPLRGFGGQWLVNGVRAGPGSRGMCVPVLSPPAVGGCYAASWGLHCLWWKPPLVLAGE